MGARGAMRHRAIVEQNVAAGEDPYGQPNGPQWALYDSVPCRAYEDRARETDDNGVVATVTEIVVLMPFRDLPEDARIAQIVDRRGSEVYGALSIVSVHQRGLDHLELRTRRAA